MQKNSFTNSLRLLMAAGSMVGFVGGWTLLAQSGKASALQPSTFIVTNAPTQPVSSIAITATPTRTTTSATPTPTATTVRVTTTQNSTLPKLRTKGS